MPLLKTLKKSAGKLRNRVFGLINIYVLRSFKNVGGLKKELFTFSDFITYLETLEKKTGEKNYWEVINQHINIKPPVLTIGNCTPASKVEARSFNYKEYVFRLRNCKVYITHYAIITEDGYLIQPVSCYYSHNKYSHELYHKLKLPSTKRLKGKTLLLNAGDNYYHMMIEGLPTIKLLEKINLFIKDFDNIIIPYYGKQWYEQVFTKLDIPEHKIVGGFHGNAFECEELFFTSFFERHGEWYCSYLKKIFEGVKPVKFPSSERIYVSRGKAVNRRIANENEVLNALSDYGFTIIYSEDLSIREQSYIFGNARYIITTHGANLVNLVFCRKAAKVCEIRYYNHPVYHKKAYMEMATHNNLEYYLLYCKQGKVVKGYADFDSDVYVDLNDLGKILQAMELVK